MKMAKRTTTVSVGAACVASALAGLGLASCDKHTDTQSTTTVKTTDTPEGTKRTVEKTERKVETEQKNPRRGPPDAGQLREGASG